MNLLPSYIEDEDEGTIEETTPREYEVDFSTGKLTGKIVEGLDAIKAWIWFAIKTPRYRHIIYTWDYGNDFEDLIGKSYTQEYIEIEARRMLEDCLLLNENIQEITDFSASIDKSTLTISFRAVTAYGDIYIENERVA